ncbi:MAG: hypothetical protein M3Z14_01060, partial [Candidatus Eremiobacteraeota bacterium]|nr:hypothetical protein [Candidatus Eremiobacteraeota bacterium]
MPGVPLAIILRRRRNLADTFLSSALLGILIASLPVWFPPTRIIALTHWAIDLLWLSAASAICVAFLVRPRNKALTFSGLRIRIRLLYFVPWLILSVGYATVLLTRPILEADALNYTLPAAQNYVTLNHFSLILSQKFTIGSNISVGWPPLVPWLCALGIEIGRLFHQSPDRAIRFIPLVYLLIFWVAAHKIAHVMLPRRPARYAALLAASLPLLLFNTVAQALYLDIPIAACFLALVAAVLSEQPVVKALALGAWALLAVLTKVTGLPLVMVLAFCCFIYYIGGITARIAMVTSVVALVMLAAKFGLLLNFAGAMQWIVLAAVTMVFWYAIPERRQPWKIGMRSALLAFVAFLPVIWYFVERLKTSGGLWEYYIPGRAVFHPPNWEWAEGLILHSNLLDTYVPHGVREHLGVGVLLWWGFSPILMLVASFGAVLAIRNESPLRLPVTISAMVLIVWLTVFHSQDYRHLLPVLPFEAIFLLYAIQNVFRRMPSVSNFVVAGCFVIDLPLAWIAQQNYYASPISNAIFNQDAAWTTHTLAITLFLTVACAIGIASLRFSK